MQNVRTAKPCLEILGAKAIGPFTSNLKDDFCILGGNENKGAGECIFKKRVCEKGRSFFEIRPCHAVKSHFLFKLLEILF